MVFGKDPAQRAPMKMDVGEHHAKGVVTIPWNPPKTHLLPFNAVLYPPRYQLLSNGKIIFPTAFRFVMCFPLNAGL